MMRNYLRSIISIILIISCISIIDVSILSESCDDQIGSLQFVYHGAAEYDPTYADLIKDYLAEIGIEVIIKNVDWETHIDILFETHNFDITNLWLAGGGYSPDWRFLYSTESESNIFQLSKDIPYQNLSEEMQNLGVTLADFNERQKLYFDWQNLVMDKIIPIVPLNTYQRYSAIWSNIKGYDMQWGLDASSPYMSFEGLHEGQVTSNEFNIQEYMWEDLNPLILDVTGSRTIWDLCSDPIIVWSPDQIPKKNGLVYDWEQIEDNHFKFFMRDNVFWNPSFNVTNRNTSSPPLLTETSPNVWEVTDPSILMYGLKNNEVSNGINQQITAKDAVFTYLVLGNLNISERNDEVQFISNIYVDSEDDLAFHVIIDKDPVTTKIEAYVDFFYGMSQNCLPEFFLNSTRTDVTFSSGKIKTIGLYDDMLKTPQWSTFRNSCFGHGKFMLDYSINNTKIVLSRNPFWFGVGEIDGEEGLKPFVDRINVHIIPYQYDSFEDFKSGLLDIYWSLFPEERAELQSDIRYIIHSEPANYLCFICFNLQRSFIGGEDNFKFLTEQGKENITKACAVRKAISYAINKNEINEIKHEGKNIIANSVIYPYTSFYYYEDIIKYDCDLDKAREWLIAAGYIDTEKITLPTLNYILALLVLPIFIFLKKRKREKVSCLR